MNDWIEWHGGAMPHNAEGKRVEAMLRSGDSAVMFSQHLRWSHEDTAGDIVKYRIATNSVQDTTSVETIIDGEYQNAPLPAMSVPGYEPLADVLERAYHQAASGKGAERHAQGEPFTQQVMQDMARRFGVGSLLGQAFKKSEESQRLPHARAVAELLGAINYLAGAIIHMELTGGGNDQ